MKVGSIVLLVAVIGFFIFESVSLVMTIVKRKKEKKGATDKQAESEVENNNNEKEV